MSLIRRFFAVAPTAISRALQGDTTQVSPENEALVEDELAKPPRPRAQQEETPVTAPATSLPPAKRTI